ncbi:MAG: hypothetical protein ACF8LK_02410, partial [Phycisphaerales bacterium JB041]
ISRRYASAYQLNPPPCFNATSRAFELLGSVSAKSFIDTTIPAATAEATYFLRTHRDAHTSDACAPIVVRLGVNAAGTVNSSARTGVAALAA